MQAYDLEQVRAALPALHDWTYLNTGTIGIMAEPVLQRHLAYITDHERFGHATQQRAIDGYERARTTLATLLNASPNDIALNRNATDGINWIAASYPLAAGDEVLTSTEEHPAMIFPLLAACARVGAHLRYMPLDTDPDRFRAAVIEHTNARTRLVAISHVSCETGARVPVHIVRDVVGPEVAVLVDASQSVGQFAVDIPALRADYVIGNGHKWLAGPKGTGFAWLHPQAIDRIRPMHYGDGTIDPPWSRALYQVDVAPSLRYTQSAARFEHGTRAWHMYEALADAIDYQAALGWDAIFAHVRRMSDIAKGLLDELDGVTVITPERWDDASGIITFLVADDDVRQVSRALWDDWAITQRTVEVPGAIRVSCTYFTSEVDLLRLRDAVAAQLRSSPSSHR